ncbi:MAG TPA: carbonic anhydrase [Longimicrobiales bacterium]|nr:carbonic anhydrase [Longimicrobiales bacterium]
MPKDLIEGLKRFRTERFPHFREHYERLVSEGQHPRALFIGCCDSRVVPDALMDTRPGELFIVRNVGNFVPPYEEAGGLHGVSAAIEFAVVVLGVSDIIVCGHSHCGAIRSLYELRDPATPHINNWLSLGMDARVEGDVGEDMLRRTEQRSVLLQLSRLLTFEVVRERVESGSIALHGWHYIIESGTVLIADLETGEFHPAGE